MPDSLELRVRDVTYYRRDELLNVHSNLVLVSIVIEVKEGHSLSIVALYPALGDCWVPYVPANVPNHPLFVVYRVLRPNVEPLRVLLEEAMDEPTVLRCVLDVLLQVREQVVLPRPSKHAKWEVVHIHPLAILLEASLCDQSVNVWVPLHVLPIRVEHCYYPWGYLLAELPLHHLGYRQDCAVHKDLQEFPISFEELSEFILDRRHNVPMLDIERLPSYLIRPPVGEHLSAVGADP